MSGHSKWSTIKHQKAAEDKKRGKIFSKVAKAITIATKEGGGSDPGTNAKLRLAIDQAKEVNMPKDNIKRAIERGMGKGGEGDLETVVYEGFGPENTALMVECITDNKNRTAAEMKSFFDKRGGGLGSPGSTSYLFEKKGLLLVKKTQNVEDQLLQLIDMGADDVEEDEDLIEVYTPPDNLAAVKEQIDKNGLEIKEAMLAFKPKTMVLIDEGKKDKVLSFLEDLEDLEDVQKVYINADFVTS